MAAEVAVEGGGDECASAEDVVAANVAISETENRLRERIADLEDALLRARADLENYRKRMERERQTLVECACESLLTDLLPVLDNFEFGLNAASGGAKDGNLLSGFSMIYEQLQRILLAQGVEAVGNLGDRFDPHCAEAVGTTYHDSIPADHIVYVARRGYHWSGAKRLLRPAAVIVSNGVAPGAQADVERETAAHHNDMPT